jgi:hypothetical protein
LTAQNNDASMTYEGTHRPLRAYSTALSVAGLVIETIREPAKDNAGKPTAPFFDLLARRPLQRLNGRPGWESPFARRGCSLPAGDDLPDGLVRVDAGRI